jgi:hypothetical protein
LEPVSFEVIPELYRIADTGCVRHRERILAAQMASCFYCATVFDIQAIEQWIDGGQTALPHCGIDGVLPVIGDEPDVAFLWAMHRYWF